MADGPDDQGEDEAVPSLEEEPSRSRGLALFREAVRRVVTVYRSRGEAQIK